ncbi:MAG: DUF2892 domain-containing protein [Nitrospiria bacterium]
MMKQNVGTTDRMIRVFIGLAILALGVYFHSGWGAIGLVPLFTGAIGWCPLYLPFGFTSCPLKH